MENTNQKTITYVGAAIIAILLLGLILTIVFNAKNKKNLRAEKLTSENLISGKSKVEEELAKTKNDFSVLKQQYDANTKLLSETDSKIAENDKRINALSFENRSLRANKKELEELKKTKAELEKEFSQLKSEHDRLLAQSGELQNSFNSLEEEKKNLASQFERAQLYNTDNFLVTATRGKKTEKIVICASRAKKLNMAFEVPQSLTETISFKIVTPLGTTINPDDKAMSWFFPLDSRTLTASLSSITGEFEQSRQVVLNYAPKGKLVKGEYKIQILCDGNNIGNCRLMLK
jgi:predicted RNase H-like nuclease (RuvC/YqgF family)